MLNSAPVMDSLGAINNADRLLFAVPKKGRLHERCLALLAGIDVRFHRKPRHDIALATNLPITIVFLPAADIAAYVGAGNVDLGITGRDIVMDTGNSVEDRITEEMPLGFGKCQLQVQVPIASGVVDVAQLAGKRVVTSFENLARSFFDRVDADAARAAAATGVAPPSKTEIRYVSGSVEAACALGLADGIVDLVESGETMRAANLHAIATIVVSEALLISNTASQHKDLIQRLKTRIQGIIAAEKYVLCKYNISRDLLGKAKLVTPGMRAPTVSALDDGLGMAVSSMVLRADIAEVMDRLKAVGASDVIVIKLDNCRV